MGKVARWLLGTLVVVLAALAIAASQAERFLNRVEPVALPPVSEAARALHEQAFVADLHADSLLFRRDLLARSDVGHVDLPRLVEGGVALQAFTLVTRAPLGMNIDRTDGDAPDMLTLVGLLRLDGSAFRSPLERALDQAAWLRELVARSQGALLPVRWRADLAALESARGSGRATVGALLGVEGAHALDDDPSNLAPLFEAGVRMIGLTHFFDTHFAGSAHGLEKGGLTDAGRALVRAMEARGVLVDLAHLSPAGVDELLALATKPTVVSHGGVQGTCDNARTLSDTQLRAIAAGGGVVGIGYWETAVCGTEPRHVVAAMAHVIELVGDDHVGLGSDYDGATTVGFDTSRLPALTQAMLDAGFSPETVRKVLGTNVLRVLRAVLPEDPGR